MNRLSSILLQKCPRCRKGQVYEKPRHFWNIPPMKTNCEVCGYKYDREPGYFLGAMYISYGLAVLEGFIVFFLLYFLMPDLPLILIPTSIVLVLVLLSMWNYKMSRIVYMHIFPW